MFPTRDIKIGTSGYSYPGAPPKGWYGAFYPEKKTKGFDELKYYSQIFNTCEINSTFYRPPSSAITTAWASKTPDDFSFAIKLWQKFTHPMKIGRGGSEDQWEPPTQKDFDDFRSGILPLIEQAGFLLTNPNSRLQFARNQMRLAISFTFVLMDETPKHGGIQKNHGKDMIICTLAPRSKNTQSESPLPQALLV